MTQAPAAPTSRQRPCPQCGAARVPAYAPFCSAGCRDRDLIRWLDDGYAIPIAPPSEDDDPS